MKDPEDPQDGIVHVDPPLLPEDKSPGVKRRDTVRIQLPVRDSPEASAAQSLRPSNQASIASLTADLAPLEPKKEMARISSVARTSQSLTQENNAFGATRIIPETGIPVTVAEKNSNLVWWILLGLAALILLIQIWTYVS